MIMAVLNLDIKCRRLTTNEMAVQLTLYLPSRRSMYLLIEQLFQIVTPLLEQTTS